MAAIASRKRQNGEPLSVSVKKIKILQEDGDASDSDEGGEQTLKINEEYARRFEHNKKRTELHQLEEKYGKGAKQTDQDSESDSEDESEDDAGELATEDLDTQIFATLQAIRTKDPRVYDEKIKFYDDVDDEEEESELGQKEDKPMFLKDYHRKNLLEGQDAYEEAPLKTYAQEQEFLKRSLVDAVHAAAADDKDSDSDADDDEDGFLQAKRVVSAKKETAPIPDVAIADREPETFLSNFLASRAWVPTDSSRFARLESDDEEEERRADMFEEAYNLRFEDPELSNQKLLSHARDAAAKYSARREEVSVRKKAREKERSKKDEEKHQRQLERMRLRKLKIDEMEDRISRIREAAGLKGKSVKLEEWTTVLEGDWDDSRFDEEMCKHFGEAYYEDEDELDKSDDADSGKKTKKKAPKKPTWDDDLDIKDIIPDFEDDDEQPNSDLALSEDDDEVITGSSSTRRNHKKEKADAKAMARRDRRMIESLVDQTLPLDTAASSSKNFTPFRYRETSPVTFGLTPLDILIADDAQLNEFAGLKKLAAFRDPERKKRDKKKLGKKARLRQWRKDTFGREDGPVLEEVFAPAASSARLKTRREELSDADGDDSNIKEGERKKCKSNKKKRGKKAPGGIGFES